MMSMKRTKQTAICGILVACEIVLSRFCSINAWNIKIGFNFIPIAVAAILFGAFPAGIVAAMGDFLGAVLFPIGPYFLGFTVTAFAIGIMLGLLLHQRQDWKHIIFAVVLNQLLLSLLLNSLWISILYSAPFRPLLVTRSVQVIILTPIQIFGIYAASKLICRVNTEWGC